MEALAQLKNVQAAILPVGKLSMHEEFPDETATTIKSFLIATNHHQRKNGS
jgi:hypothetical protein